MEAKDLAIVAVVMTALGVALMVLFGVAVPAADDALASVEAEHPGLLRDVDAGPACVGFWNEGLDGQRTRAVECR